MNPETTAPEAVPDADRSTETETGPAGLSAKAGPLVASLSARVREEGSFYVKSQFIATDLDLSAKEVGAFMRQLRARDGGRRSRRGPTPTGQRGTSREASR